jgi:hypothetical protein
MIKRRVFNPLPDGYLSYNIRRLEQEHLGNNRELKSRVIPAFASIASQIFAATSGPPSRRGLELASDDLHDGIGGVVAASGSHRALGGDDGFGSFIHGQQLPSDGLIAAAAACDLPDPHDGVVVLREADGVNLDIPGVAVIPKLENVP